MDLTDRELRVLGSLVEKEMTTPDHYPLTLNALVAACNQRTSRDPVVEYTDAAVIEAVNALCDRSLCRLTRLPGQRAVKYRHALGPALELEPPALAVLAVLVLRGAQTPGELRSRTARYHEFASTAEVQTELEVLSRRRPALAERLPRRPGEKEHRWRHVLGGEDEPGPAPGPPPPSVASPLEARVEALEAEVARLARIVDALGGPD